MSLRNYLEQQGYQRVKLKKLKTGHYKTSMKINCGKGEFIVDTGASTSCIGFENIDHFALTSQESEIKAAGAGAIDMETKLAKGNQIVLGDKRAINYELVLFNLTHVNTALAQVKESPVHGIIGADLLKKFRAVIDYGRNCMYLR